ncbi:DoxX family membrane protein [Bordetella petrii]|nr:DoxX family membrane protein [Bordetella petrii]
MMKSDDTGKLILRLALGILVLMHGLAKLSGGVGGISGMLSSHGLPGFLAYGAYVGEVIGPLLVIVGLYTRLGALFIVINMLVAILLVHTGQVFGLNQQGGWALELQGMFLFGALAVAFLGAGRFGLGGSGGRWN